METAMMLIFLLVGFILGTYCLYQAYILLIRKNTQSLKRFKNIQQHQVPIVSKQFGILQLLVGTWLIFFNLFEIIAADAGGSDSSRNGFLIAVGIFAIGESMIKRKNRISK